jgi:glycine cleavage system aminomethyltransferase T
VVYTALLNRHGRFVSDVTIARLSETEFSLMTAAVQTVHDLDWLERQRAELGYDVTLTDVTGDWAVLAVMGPRSRDLLRSICSADFGNAAFPFGTAQNVVIAGKTLRAQRLTYVGELGWELHIPAADALTVFDAIEAAGRSFQIQLAGTMAMNSLRMEKSYVSWSHDVSLDDTPLEAGLGFAVAWDKETEFIGRDELQVHRQRGSNRRLITFLLDDPEPVLWGHEPIYRDGSVVGFTSSGSYAHTLGRAIGMGYVRAPGRIDRAWVEAGQYEIEVAGTRFSATAHWRAPFDPERARILA